MPSLVPIRLGIDVLLQEQLDLVRGKRVGLVTAASSIDHELVTSADRLFQHPEVNLQVLFGPEHGLRGAVQAGVEVETAIDPIYGLPVHSLYGKTHKPTPDMLKDLDILLLDLPDGGVRFYTFLSTMVLCIQACGEVGLPLVILDRPNPITGTVIEGPILDLAYSSFVGMYPIPIRYGMTYGEIAQLLNSLYHLNCQLHVVQVDGWRRELWLDQTSMPFVPPSPNLPTLAALMTYPGTCLFEGTNLSEGRGTTRPFEYIGAPWVKPEATADALNSLGLCGVRFRPIYFLPMFSKHADQHCGGVQVYITNREAFLPVTVALYMLAYLKSEYPQDFAWREPWSSTSKAPIDLLSGGSQLREQLDAHQSVPALLEAWQASRMPFLAQREQFLLYA